MTSIKKRCLQNSDIRPNYAKTAKECGMEHINILKIRQYLKDDWETKIESFKGKVDWKYLIRCLFKIDIYKLSRRGFKKVCYSFGMDDATIALLMIDRRWIKYLSERYSRRVRNNEIILNNEMVNLKKEKKALIEVKNELEKSIMLHRILLDVHSHTEK
ncbi:hypothetical protein LOD99_33 [Oopsacas minuta]|uniref:Uncharacterized protein n=1 Tax=Oopsacas minuta TaxID=111878 RepID=A0AAV7K8X1_9METZ|nr:hypothetical protein LOD99_33 [Oopsacas minuta]